MHFKTLLTSCTLFSTLLSTYADFVYVTNSPDELPGYTAVYKVDIENGNVRFVPNSHSHLFNKLDIHTTFMYTYAYHLSLATHSLIHILTQAITHTYITLEPQGYVSLTSTSVWLHEPKTSFWVNFWFHMEIYWELNWIERYTGCCVEILMLKRSIFVEKLTFKHIRNKQDVTRKGRQVQNCSVIGNVVWWDVLQHLGGLRYENDVLSLLGCDLVFQ